MTNKEKAQMIQGVIDHPGRERTYYSLLEDMGDLSCPCKLHHQDAPCLRHEEES